MTTVASATTVSNPKISTSSAVMVFPTQIGSALLLIGHAVPLFGHVQDRGAVTGRKRLGDFPTLTGKASVIFRPAWHAQVLRHRQNAVRGIEFDRSSKGTTAIFIRDQSLRKGASILQVKRNRWRTKGGLAGIAARPFGERITRGGVKAI
jgi:hypothetical protein